MEPKYTRYVSFCIRKIKDNTLRIEDGKNSVNLFINDDMYGNSIHIYIRK